jgi:hypothetical protein
VAGAPISSAKLHQWLLHRANCPRRHKPFFATSTDGVHAAILTEHLLYIFPTSTKAKIAEIELIKKGAPDGTNISNVPWGLLYNGDTLFVFGQDAGPFTGAWVFKEDGSRAGIVHDDGGTLNIFNGGYGALAATKSPSRMPACKI